MKQSPQPVVGEEIMEGEEMCQSERMGVNKKNGLGSDRGRIKINKEELGLKHGKIMGEILGWNWRVSSGHRREVILILYIWCTVL